MILLPMMMLMDIKGVGSGCEKGGFDTLTSQRFGMGSNFCFAPVFNSNILRLKIGSVEGQTIMDLC